MQCFGLDLYKDETRGCWDGELAERRSELHGYLLNRVMVRRLKTEVMGDALKPILREVVHTSAGGSKERAHLRQLHARYEGALQAERPSVQAIRMARARFWQATGLAKAGMSAAELEKLRKKLKVSAGLVKKLRDNETGLKDELATAQKRIAEGMKDRDAEDRAVATQKNLLRKTEADLVALRAELKAKDAELTAREEANAETAKTQAAKAEALHERVEALRLYSEANAELASSANEDARAAARRRRATYVRHVAHWSRRRRPRGLAVSGPVRG